MFKIKNPFKPSWVVIEVYHERYTFDTYYTYCRHMTFKEVLQMFRLSEENMEKDRDGNFIFDECYYGDEGEYLADDTFLEKRFKLKSYQINYTIVIPARNMKKDDWFITGKTCNKFGLFDREWLKNEENSTDK